MPTTVKRPYNKTRRKLYKKYGARQVTAPAAATLQAAVRRVLQKNIETKQSNFTSTDGVEIGHNSFVSVDSAILATDNGTSDPATSSSTNRIGDEINLKGVAFKIMLENNHRYSDTTFRIMVIKAAKGDTPTTATIFNGLSNVPVSPGVGQLLSPRPTRSLLRFACRRLNPLSVRCVM